MVGSMKYQGGKYNISGHIVSYIHSYIISNNIETYIEPFVGGGSILVNVNCKNKIASDLNKHLIALYIKGQNGMDGIPDDIDERIFKEVRENIDTGRFPDWYIGAVGFFGGFNGRGLCGGYAKNTIEITNSGRKVERCYYKEVKRSFERDIAKLMDVTFKHGDYTIHSEAKGALIYCDPPYKNTSGYKEVNSFNHDDFWQWVREMSKNNIVLVSEEQAPKDFDTIWEEQITRSLNTKSADRGTITEKLFKYAENSTDIGLDF